MRDDARLHSAALLSEFWDGKEIKRIRTMGDMFTLRDRRMSMHLLVQPGVAERFFGDQILRDQGITTRFLTVMPETAAGTRFQRDPEPCRFSKVLHEILKRPLPLNETNELTPRIIELSPEAKEKWRQFADEIERQIGPSGALESVRGLANKLPEHATRLRQFLP